MKKDKIVQKAEESGLVKQDTDGLFYLTEEGQKVLAKVREEEKKKRAYKYIFDFAEPSGYYH